MKKLLGLLVVGFFLVTPAVHAEEILNFNSDLLIEKSGHVLVTETIIYDFDGANKHGIFRILKTNHPQAASTWYKKRSIALDVKSVTADNKTVPYTITDSSDAVEVKIGDANHTISGKHTYVITYDMAGALSYGSSGSELYYNVTGNDWPVQIDRFNAEIHDDAANLLGTDSVCYRGAAGSTDRCDVATTTKASVVFFSTAIPPGEGITIAQSLQSNHIAELINENFLVPIIPAALLFFTVIGLIWLNVWALRYHFAFKSKRPVVAQYEPFEGILPMYTGMLFDEKLDPRDITAGIIYLAEQGFIKITRLDQKVMWIFDTTDYQFTLLKPVSEMKVPALIVLLDLFFHSNEQVGESTTLSLFKEKRQAAILARAQLVEMLRADLKKDGFISTGFPPFVSWASFCIVVMTGGLLLYLKNTIVLVLVSIGLFIPLVLFYSRRTTRGYEALNYLQGFKLFLSVTETERYKFFNAPEKNPEQFMHFLPYAIAFGVEKEWAKAFEGITIPNPDWYSGGSLNAFSAVALTTDLGAFSTAFAASSGTSGSSGGGSSGGGGGGGGGGSW